MRLYKFFTKSALGVGILVLFFFSANTYYFSTTGQEGITMFMAFVSFIIAILLPFCSRKIEG